MQAESIGVPLDEVTDLATDRPGGAQQGQAPG
jgi:hypothetical protein